ncbi:MAG: hypothetical protein IT373_31825 [Polyangiaceae bacterium]|nr:hypothetical protein [Polyangiaceae bacterium]
MSEVVKPGDVVLYGGELSTRLLFVDTILCVGAMVPLPQSDGFFAIRENVQDVLAALCVKVCADDFYESRAYRLNLRDAERDGCHPTSQMPEHRILLGKRFEDGEVPGLSAESLIARFDSGLGFDLIPLCNDRPSTDKRVLARPGLFVTRFPEAASVCKSKVSLLEPDQTKMLLTAVFHESDTLVLDPLEPVHHLERATRNHGRSSDVRAFF